MKRRRVKRAMPSSKAAAISEEGASNGNNDSDTNSTSEELSPWRAESILSHRAKIQQTKTETTNDTSATSFVPSWSICERDWWETDNNDKKQSLTETNTSGMDDSHSDSSSTTGERQRKRTKRIIKSRKKTFHNIGLQIWNTSRAKWKSYKKPTRKKSVFGKGFATTHYREIVRGLTSFTREYLLPEPMNLSDLIEVYQDIWDNSHE